MIVTEALAKHYGEVRALDGVDLAVPPGTIYGLVGPNGAGKTTLLAILARLRRPTSGEVRVATHRLGHLPDAPRFDGWLTAREVVELSAHLAAVAVTPSSVDDVLERVGLAGARSRRVGGFSRGMLQRLGLATVAILEPDLWLLDEPAAALDPAGRREVLDLVATLRGRATVLLSSHILGDVEQVCDRVGILRQGRLLYQGALRDLLDRHTGFGWTVEVRGDPRGLAQALEREPWVRTVTTGDARLELTVTDPAEAERCLVPLLAAGGLPVVAVVPRRVTLEDVFLEMTR